MALLRWIDTHITLHEHDNPKEERANALTHLLGILLSAAAFLAVVVNHASYSRAGLLGAFLIYTGSMLLLYSASTLYHHLPRNVLKKLCRVFDHANIYILIAGTYTPILTFIGSSEANYLLLLQWGIVVAGIILTLAFWGRFKILHVLLYLAMGWSLVFFWDAVIPNIPKGLLAWVLAGGITYTAGTGFYAAKKLPYYHAVWHLFVLGGSICFYIGFMRYLV